MYKRGRFRGSRPDGGGVGVIGAMTEDTDHNIWVVAWEGVRACRVRIQGHEGNFLAAS